MRTDARSQAQREKARRKQEHEAARCTTATRVTSHTTPTVERHVVCLKVVDDVHRLRVAVRPPAREHAAQREARRHRHRAGDRSEVSQCGLKVKPVSEKVPSRTITSTAKRDDGQRQHGHRHGQHQKHGHRETDGDADVDTVRTGAVIWGREMEKGRAGGREGGREAQRETERERERERERESRRRREQGPLRGRILVSTDSTVSTPHVPVQSHGCDVV
jgi:hypothetical protein